MRLAQVVAVHNERRTVDLIYLDTSLRVAEVHILSSLVADDAGAWDMPSVLKPSSEVSAGSLSATTGRKVVAAVDEVAGRPVVVGFLHPLGGQMAFTEDNRQVYRHMSGFYSTVAPDGSFELWHPSGSYARIGTGAHQPLAPLSRENVWKEIGTASQPTITVKTAQFSLVIDPSGNTTLTTTGTLSVSSQGNMSLSTQGTLAVSSQGAMTIHSASTVTITGSTVSLNP